MCMQVLHIQPFVFIHIRCVLHVCIYTYICAYNIYKVYIFYILLVYYIRPCTHLLYAHIQGVAACNINGCTLHSWSGIQTGAKPLHKLWPSARVTKHWNSAETLIIDEISMISDEIFDLVANFGAKVRGNSQYFGGTQVVICGDFFQLPPVGDNDVKYCFESKIFQLLFNSTNIIILDKVYRQADGKFQSYLQQIRRGVLTLEVEQVLQTRSYFDVDNAVRLYPRNKEVDALNESKLGEICSDIHEFVAKDEYLPANKLYFDELISGIKAVHTLRLKIGMCAFTYII